MVKLPFKDKTYSLLEMEEWKVAIETYEISNLGNCRKLLKTGEYITIKGSIQSKGYRYFQINRNKKRSNYLFHHLVMEQFIGPRPEGLVIDHIDRDKLNNNVSNLRYVTQKENMFNLKNTLTHIPQDTPNRRSLCAQDYAMRNRDLVKEKKRLYHEENKDRIKEKQRLYYQKNKDRIKEKSRLYHEENKDRINLRRRVDMDFNF